MTAVPALVAKAPTRVLRNAESSIANAKPRNKTRPLTSVIASQLLVILLGGFSLRLPDLAIMSSTPTSNIVIATTPARVSVSVHDKVPTELELEELGLGVGVGVGVWARTVAA